VRHTRAHGHRGYGCSAFGDQQNDQRHRAGLRDGRSGSSAVARPAAPDLDAGDPVTLGAQYRALRSRFPQLTILGGCCGTDHRYVEQICFACAEEEREVA